MRWEDERYVRLFTRDTVAWDMWPWEARVLFPLVLRKVDRAGLLDLGKYGSKGLASMVKVPFDVVDAGLSALLEDGCLEIRGSCLVMRNFIAAQECNQSDKARKAAQRERDRIAAISPENVTSRDDASQHVTFGHKESHAVTDGHSVPCRAVLKKEDTSVSPTAGSDEPTVPPQSPATTSVVHRQTALPTLLEQPSDGPTALERKVFEHWIAGWRKHVGGKRPPKFDAKRRARVRARIREGYSVDDLCAAVDGLWKSPFHMGENKGSKRYIDLELVCRDATHVDDFIACAEQASESSGSLPIIRLPNHDDLVEQDAAVAAEYAGISFGAVE